jgi:hypothetical protein
MSAKVFDVIAYGADVLRVIPNILATPIESNFKPAVLTNFCADNWHIVIGVCIAYCLMITLGPRLMSNSPGYTIKLPLACWNAFLCAFSFIGMVKTVSIHIN